ncbi:Unannotated [Lentimonas sp. CC19]|nr:Unannotated [Lentimonas sp. CC10]CAA6696206.1 Unannotated [Lentimonas sp. CC19]CAA7070883.1 Unannotated [Lentimonas sp. CC11]
MYLCYLQVFGLRKCLFLMFLTASQVFALVRLRIVVRKNLLDHALTAEGSEVFLLRFSPIFTG